ncbi:prepilin peptidase [Planktotalea sp.]|uniref:prepilin peptidase n=1 Tax=Planktotalea sp. TaxID=2029877 RepID=UPI0035C87131
MFWLMVLLFLSGASWGSFLNAVGGRMVWHMSVDEAIRDHESGFGRSHRSKCYHCKKVLGPWQLIPVFSLLLQRGRTDCCNEPLPLHYLASELLFAFVFVCLGALGVLLPEFISLVVLSSVLYLLYLSDVRHMEVPVALVAALWIISVTHCLAIVGEELYAYVISVTVGFSLLFIPGFVTSKILKKSSLGIADPLVFAALSAYLQITLVPYFLICSSLVGIIWYLLHWHGRKIPFLPSIVLAFVLIFGLQEVGLVA